MYGLVDLAILRDLCVLNFLGLERFDILHISSRDEVIPFDLLALLKANLFFSVFLLFLLKRVEEKGLGLFIRAGAIVILNGVSELELLLEQVVLENLQFFSLVAFVDLRLNLAFKIVHQF